MSVKKQDALDYHALPTPGKISIAPTKPSATQLDLSLAYTPGVADACLEIAREPKLAGRYTSRSNLVAVVTNGTAVLGLGDIGPAAGKPVMEGKAVLFKRFADIDVFDLELNTKDPDEIIRTVQLLEPTFGGGINVKADPVCASGVGAVEGMQALMARHEFGPDEVERIECGVRPHALNILMHHQPKTGLEAKFSAEYWAAITLLRGRLGLQEVTNSHAFHPHRARIARRRRSRRLSEEPER